MKDGVEEQGNRRKLKKKRERGAMFSMNYLYKKTLL